MLSAIYPSSYTLSGVDDSPFVNSATLDQSLLIMNELFLGRRYHFLG